MNQSHLTHDIAQTLRHPAQFSARAGRTSLRSYQIPVIETITKSIQDKAGLTFVVIFPRQSGKNETQLALYTYLLTHAQREGGDIIHVEPTYKPQTETAMFRLQKKLTQCSLTRGKWRKMFGYIYAVGAARVVHFSGEPTANVVGSTAGLLMSVNEAQDILISKFDKDFGPMSASTNATRVFWGTRWTADTLLEREFKAATEAQERDGCRRVFFVTAEDVGKVLEPYRLFVEKEISRLGRQHPLVRTQYFCETIDAQAGMFPPARIMLMRGDHPKEEAPRPGCGYVFCIDVAGQDEKSISPGELDNPARDSTVLTILRVDVASIDGPTFRTVNRMEWIGEKHTTVNSQIKNLAALWRPQYLAIDATGVGEGLWSMLDAALPGKIIPIKFTEAEKSAIGYQLIAMIESGHLLEYSPLDEVLLTQCQNARSEIRTGPQKTLKWGVPDGTRDKSGQFLHDDYLLSLALVTVINRLPWSLPTTPSSVDGFDPIGL